MRDGFVQSKADLDLLTIEVDGRGGRKYAMVTMPREDVKALVDVLSRWLGRTA